MSLSRAADERHCHRTSAREHGLAVRLASDMKAGRVARAGTAASRPSALLAAVLVAVLSLGVFIGAYGLWAITQQTGAVVVEYVPGSPRITASRTLDPGTDVEERVSILASWVPRRLSDDPYWEKRMMGLTPMSLYDELHYRPDNL